MSVAGPRICSSLAAPDIGALRGRLAECSDADLIEVRLDALAEVPTAADLRSLLAACPVDALVTCRPDWEGGGWSGSEESRRALLESALEAGARWIDVEMEATWAGEMLGAVRDRVVLSHHAPAPRPPLDALVDRLEALSPAVAKLVAPADAPGDALPLLRAGADLRRRGVAATTFCMGAAGRASRLLDAAAGGAWIYAAHGDDVATAPGQWDLRTLRRELRIGRWDAAQRRYALIGDPIDHSLSPTVFNAAFEAAREPALYLPLPGAPFAEVIALAEATDIAGLSVTMPFKGAAAAHARALTDAADAMQAANTLARDANGWVGHNTDGDAVVAVLSRQAALEDAVTCILGAGGAARAAAHALAAAGARVRLLNRTVGRAEAAAEQLGVDHGGLDWLRTQRAAIVVNATPVGLETTAQTPIPTAWLQGDEVVLDMIYRPQWTPFLVQARGLGCTVVSGLEMFLEQAAAQYRIWTGAEAPRDVMATAARDALSATDSEDDDG